MEFVTQIDNKMKALNCYDVLVAAFELYRADTEDPAPSKDDSFTAQDGFYLPEKDLVVLYLMSTKGRGFWCFEFHLDPANLAHKCVYIGRDFIDLCEYKQKWDARIKKSTHTTLEFDDYLISEIVH